MFGKNIFPKNEEEFHITTKIIEKYFSKESCQKKDHQQPKFQLHHENGQQYCWGCISIDIYKKRKPFYICDLCYGFLKDWLELPLSQDDVFYKLQSKRSLQRFIYPFAQGLLKWLHRVGDLDNSVLMANVKVAYEYFHSNPEYIGIDEELFWATAMLRECLESPFRDDIKYWIDMATDCGVLYDYEDVPLWTSLWFWKAWNAIPTIHAEHMQWKSVSYAGPALGMKPLPMANTPSETNVCHPHSLLHEPLENLLGLFLRKGNLSLYSSKRRNLNMIWLFQKRSLLLKTLFEFLQIQNSIHMFFLSVLYPIQHAQISSIQIRSVLLLTKFSTLFERVNNSCDYGI